MAKRKTMPSDPLIEEVRQLRTALSARFGHDLRKLCDHLRQVEQRYPGRLVRRKPTRPARKTG